MVRIALLLLSVLWMQLLSAGVIRVGKTQLYKSIKPALQSARAGDTVWVEKGFYKEGNLVIDKPIWFLGIGLPVIDGDRKFEVITVKSSHVVIRGFKVQHSGYATLDDPGGIKVINSTHVTITHNILYDNFFGVYIQYGKQCTIRDNRIVAFGKEEQHIGNGIHCWKSDSLVITGNTIAGHRDGIYFEFVTHSTIRKNTADGNIRYGLHFMFSNDDVYEQNIFRNNGAGVAVMFTKNVTMVGNVFEQNWGDASYGLLLKEISDSYISENRFDHNTMGIFMEGTNRIRVEKNRFLENGWAMKIQASCADNEIRANNFLGNTFDIGTNGSLVLNTFDGNYWDKYEGYDLNRDQRGDVPYHPLSLFAVLVEHTPSAMILFRSFMINLLDRSEKILPSITPDNFVDRSPLMRPVSL